MALHVHGWAMGLELRQTSRFACHAGTINTGHTWREVNLGIFLVPPGYNGRRTALKG